ncbi:glutaredoxin family protein [bacterium]|nr:glutaredoxin family protein [bacterium]
MSLLDRLRGPARRPRVLLVTKMECPLCEEAKAELEHASSEVAFDLELRSIEDDPELARAHALEVPVIFVDGKKKLFGRVSRTLLLRELRGAARS